MKMDLLQREHERIVKEEEWKNNKEVSKVIKQKRKVAKEKLNFDEQ